MPVLLDVVVQHLRSGHFAQAEQSCREGLRTAPNDLQLLSFLGAALHRQGRSDEAIAVFQRVVELRADAVDALSNLAVLQQLAGRWAEAECRLRQILSLQPDSLLALQRLGVIRQTRGDLDEALRLTRRAVRLNPAGGTDLFNVGTILMASGEPAAAARVFRIFTVAEPGAVSAHLQLAACRMVLGATDQALSSYERALRLDPASGEARDGRMRCLRYEAARAPGPGVPEGLVIRGPHRSFSGYGHMTDRFVSTLTGLGTPVQALGLFGNEPWAGSSPHCAVRGRSILSCVIPPAVERVPGLATVTFSMFEGTRIPKPWRRFSDLHDLVIVPTESSRVAWAERGYPEEQLRVCPLGVDPETQDGPILPLVTQDGRPIAGFRHRILNVSDFVPRKNIDGLLRVWLRATSRADDAVLILKLGKGNPQTRAAIEALVRQTEAAAGKRLEEAAPVVIIDRTLDDLAMDGLFRAATHYWSLSHGEGWDLPMSKAGAMGMELIAPAHSAYVDYLDETVAHMIPSVTGPAHLPNSTEPWPTFYGLDWWEPDQDAAADLIGRIIRGAGGPPRQARQRLLERFTWSQSCNRLLAILREAGAF